jgi:dihydrofolate synthase/folylpolyglutamate synthase
MNSKVYRIDTDCSIITKEVNNLEFEEFNLYSNISDNFYKDLRIRLLGKQQLINASLALCAGEFLQTKGYKISEQNIRDGLLEAFLPGRFQIFKISDRYIVLDGAHNPESSKNLYITLNNKFNGKKVIYILTTLKNKLAREIISNLIANSEIFLFTELSDSNSYTTKELKDILQNINPSIESKEINNPINAFKYALEISNKNDVICITGSLYLVGEMLKHLKYENNGGLF